MERPATHATRLVPRGADARRVALILAAWHEQGPPTMNRARRRRAAKDRARSTTQPLAARYDPA